MPDSAPKAELMRSLGRLVRGLSALFWGLPLALVIGVQAVQADWLSRFGVLPPLLIAFLLFYGLLQLGGFQRQERVWTRVLDQAKLLAITNIGLSPFLFWWHKLPEIQFYALVVGLLGLTGLGFLLSINQALRRLTAMLPDENLRQETKVFTSLNFYLGGLALVLLAVSWAAIHLTLTPLATDRLHAAHEPSSLGALPLLILQVSLDRGFQWFLVFLVLLPVATTMALLWKIKEVIFSSVFGPDSD